MSEALSRYNQGSTQCCPYQYYLALSLTLSLALSLALSPALSLALSLYLRGDYFAAG